MEGIMAQVGSLDYAGMFGRVWDFLAGLDRDVQIMLAGGLCLLLLWRAVSRQPDEALSSVRSSWEEPTIRTTICQD